jgi:DNA repair and recombination protein RAD52
MNGTTPNKNRSRPQPTAAAGRQANAGQVGPSGNPQQQQTPNDGVSRSNTGDGPGIQIRPTHESGPPSRPMQPPQPPVVAGRVLNQPSRNGPSSAPVSPARPNKSSDDNDTAGMPPQGAGFFSARAAAMIPEGQTSEGSLAPLPNHLPAFNLHAESPSIRKTPGIDHKSSKPLTRDLKHIPGSSQAAAPPVAVTRGNIVNPQLDSTRRIGAPNSPSPMANRRMYKPPLMKRPFESGGGGLNAVRAPLVDLPANGAIGGGDAAGDVKRQRLNS